jgi:ketosteroid isomerase-like protein
MALRSTPIALCLLLVVHGHAMAQQQDQLSDGVFAEVQTRFADAYNRGDLDTMAGAFTQKAVRITPSGIFDGRDAIRSSFQDALKMGLHDYSVHRTISRSVGTFVFNAGEWQAKLGGQSFHGYYSAILVREGDQAKIMEETVTIAAP